MNKVRIGIVAVQLALAMTVGCARRQDAPRWIPPPPPRPPMAAALPEDLPEPPLIALAMPKSPPIPMWHPRPLPPPEVKPEKPPSAVTAGPPAETPPAPAQPAPIPSLGRILSSEERQQYEAAVAQSLSEAQRHLAGLPNRRLTPDQQAEVARIRTFIRQANEVRPTDLVTARSLAERAEVLARNLVGVIR
jgi:hypothetical protein